MLLTTKLFIPSNDRPLVSRPRLFAMLDAGLYSRMTLVAAPAGFGKSTLVSAWIADQQSNIDRHTLASARSTSFQRVKCCWLSLDENDNDSTRFLGYVVAALQTADAKLGTALQIMVQTPQHPSLEALLTILINDIESCAMPIVLVLDDFHVITAQPVHDALTFLIEHTSSMLRLIITTRSDPPLPLARWRVRAQLTEVRASDLRFRPDEATIFLTSIMGLTLSVAEIATLEERTEGWIAALQLAAISMQGRHDLSGFIESFGGSNRFIVDYLVEEVLRRQPAEMVNVLLQTAILERVSASLCDALTGQQHGRAVLNYLEQANLFLIALDDRREWVRYHHLFRDLLYHRLRDQVGPAAINALHQRAARWYADNNLSDEAVHHFLVAGDVNQAADLIETVGDELIGQGSLARLRSWLQQLPPDLVRARPRLVLLNAWVLNLAGQSAALEQWLQDAAFDLDHVPAMFARDMQAQLTTLHAYKTRRQSNFSLAIAQLQQALGDCAPENVLTRTAINLNLGFNYWMSGQLALADQALQATQTDAKIIQATHMVLLARATQANVAVAQGKLRRAIQLCEEAIHYGLDRNEGHPFSSAGYAYAVLGNILYEQNELVQAEAVLRQALELGEMVSDGTVIRRAIFCLAPLKHLNGDEIAMQELWQRAFAADDTVEEPQVELQQVRGWLVQAALTADQQALARAAQWATAYDQHHDDTHSYISAFAQTLVAWVEFQHGQPAQTLARLIPLTEAAANAGQIAHFINMLALQSLAHAALGDAAMSRKCLCRLLELAAPERFIRTFLNLGEPMHRLLDNARLTLHDPALRAYADHLLALFEQETLVVSAASHSIDAGRHAQSQYVIEALSDRELEILRLVADGLSNSEIAKALIVTVGTVKKHLNNIYGKLGVGRRTQAVARAREMQLL